MIRSLLPTALGVSLTFGLVLHCDSLARALQPSQITQPQSSPQQSPKQQDPSTTPLHADIALADRIEPKALADAIQQSASPLVLQVGPRSFFDQAHMLGSEYAGTASTEAGLDTLRKRVETLARERWVVLYCGCCPWDKCPNIRPAWNELHRLGFTHVQALYLPTSFGTDWVDKGLPVEH